MRKIQLRLVFLCALDHRIDDEGLPALGHLFAHKTPHLPGHFSGNAPGDDRHAARRQLVEDADIEIAVKRERQGARNGRGRHHQHVRFRLIGLLHHLEALQDAEAVLLVHHHQPQPVELDLFFDERVRADHQLRLAAIDFAAGLALAALVERAGQQDNSITPAGALQQLARGQKMLRGQNLGGRHQRRLVAVFHGHQHGLQGDDGLA